MTISRITSFWSKAKPGEAISAGKLAYFRQRLRNRLYQLVVKDFLEREQQHGFTRAELARRIGRKPEQLTRWLSAPGNWTLDTVSDLMIAMNGELDISRRDLGATRRSNEEPHWLVYSHPLTVNTDLLVGAAKANSVREFSIGY